MFETLTAAFFGPAQARAAHRQALKLQPSIASGVEHLSGVCPVPKLDNDDSPIFLMSAGWRSGSTMLQRLIMSDPTVLIWGEPYDECGLIQAVANGLKAFRPAWPPAEYFYDGTPPNQLTGEWVANLFPSLNDWRLSHRALFDTLFAEPARHAGAKRWGIKEVRLTAEHCAYLKWLYPQARFLFLIRHPLDAYRSYCAYGRSWYDIFPDKPVFTPTAFGRHWKALTEGYLRESESLNALVVRYEDLISGVLDPNSIAEYLDVQLDATVLKKKVGSSEIGGKKIDINRVERWLLKKATQPESEKMGYQW